MIIGMSEVRGDSKVSTLVSILVIVSSPLFASTAPGQKTTR